MRQIKQDKQDINMATHTTNAPEVYLPWPTLQRLTLTVSPKLEHSHLLKKTDVNNEVQPNADRRQDDNPMNLLQPSSNVEFCQPSSANLPVSTKDGVCDNADHAISSACIQDKCNQDGNSGDKSSGGGDGDGDGNIDTS